jgi:hypothetical protein
MAQGTVILAYDNDIVLESRVSRSLLTLLLRILFTLLGIPPYQAKVQQLLYKLQTTEKHIELCVVCVVVWALGTV